MIKRDPSITRITIRIPNANDKACRQGAVKSPVVFASLESRNHRDSDAGRRDRSYLVGVADAARVD
jgi:hypothetical protein